MYTTTKYGILDSISKSYYMLDGKKKILFTFFCWGISLPLLVFCFNPLKIVLLIAVCSIALVGAFAMFREKMVGIIHPTCAIIGMLTSIISLYIYYNQWIALSIFILSPLSLLDKKRMTWYIEVIAFISVIIGFALTIYQNG